MLHFWVFVIKIGPVCHVGKTIDVYLAEKAFRTKLENGVLENSRSRRLRRLQKAFRSWDKVEMEFHYVGPDEKEVFKLMRRLCVEETEEGG